MIDCCNCGAIVLRLESLNHDPCNADVERELRLMSCRQTCCPKKLTYVVSLTSDEGVLLADVLCTKISSATLLCAQVQTTSMIALHTCHATMRMACKVRRVGVH
jgi:hypothetical protein